MIARQRPGLFESPAAEVLNAPDNICASPRGGFILCEDGSGTEFLHGLTVDGNIFRFAQNNVDLRANSSHGITGDFRGSEFAGATYSPDGRWLFVNVQSPGITCAITGPWRNGGSSLDVQRWSSSSRVGRIVRVDGGGPGETCLRWPDVAGRASL